MATNAKNVSAVKPRVGGCVYTAPVGTTLPTDAESALDEAFEDMGYISEDGITNSNTRESENIKAYGGDIVASPQTEKLDTFGMTFIEAKNITTLKAVYGESNVSGTLATGITIRVNSAELEDRAWVIDQIMSEGDLKRTVIPRGKITELGEITYADGSVTGFESTITAFPAEELDGDSHREYMKTPAASGNNG